MMHCKPALSSRMYASCSDIAAMLLSASLSTGFPSPSSLGYVITNGNLCYQGTPAFRKELQIL